MKGLRWAALALAAAVLVAAAWVAVPLPERLLAPPSGPTFRLFDRSGAPLRTSRDEDGALRSWVHLEELDPALLVAFVAAEDRRFFQHHGVDSRALVRALVGNLRAGRVVSGGSTITMQLARMLAPSARSWPGKLVQAGWALRLDAHLSKQEVLEQYLNRVPLGQGTVGVEEAASLYFGVSARDVSLGQAATLAGLAGAPSRMNPVVNPGGAAARRSLVLERMRRIGSITPAEEASAREEPPLLRGGASPYRAPHFSAALLAHLEQVGHEPSGPVRTPLDLPLQETLEAEVRHTVATMRPSGVRHAAAVVLDNRTGGVLAWVGSPDFFDPGSGQVDMVISPRQPGSTLKPFLYGLAFDRGYTAADVLPDVATVYQTATGPYAPRNYDRRFHGPVRVREALASSFNVPAVELVHRVGVPEFLLMLQRAGFTSLRRDAQYYGLGLALGNGDVTLLELANGYRALANGGLWRPVGWLADEGDTGAPVRVMSTASAALVIDILADPVARIPGFGPVTPLEFPFPAAAKTGTSRHFTDNWAVATTAGFTVAVWVGNFDGRPMDGVSGITGAGPLLHRAALLVARRHPPGTLVLPARTGAVSATICRLSGGLAGPYCPRTTEWFRPGSVPQRVCEWHQVGGVSLPVQYAEWTGTARPVGEDRVPDPTEAAGSRFRITSPAAGDVYRFVPGVDRHYATIGLRAAGGPRAGPVRWYLDGQPVATSRLPLAPGRHVVRAVRGRMADEVAIEVVR